MPDRAPVGIGDASGADPSRPSPARPSRRAGRGPPGVGPPAVPVAWDGLPESAGGAGPDEVSHPIGRAGAGLACPHSHPMSRAHTRQARHTAYRIRVSHMSEPGTYVEKSFKRDTHYITTRITADGREASRSRPGATGSSSPAPARGPTGRSSCGGSSASRTSCRWASAGRPTTSAAGPSTSTRAASTPCSASHASRTPTSSATPTTPVASRCRPSSTSPPVPSSRTTSSR